MKRSKKIIIAFLIFALGIGILFPILRDYSDYSALRKNEDELYLQMSKLPTEKLLSKILRLEKRFHNTEDKIVLLPLYIALMDRGEEFSEDQILEQIQNEETLSGLDSAFLRMYAANGYSPSKMLTLLDDSGIDREVKEEIVVLCDFSPAELLEIIQKYDGKTAEIAMRRLSVMDTAEAAKAVDSLLSEDNGNLSDEKYRSICLGIAGLYEQQQDSLAAGAIRDAYAPVLQKLFSQSRSQAVKDQAVYALGRMCDYPLFAWLMENDQIDFILKVSVIDRNYRTMKQWISLARSESDISAVLDAMKLHPILEIGFALQDAIQNGSLPESEELLSLIAFIQNNGMAAVDKYEK